jgi:broad specificity phosphatase PhoE
MHLLLIRHGQTSLHKNGVLAGWTNDPGLDLDGQLQVKKLAEHISELGPQLHFKAIYTSPLPQAKMTAEMLSIIGELRNLKRLTIEMLQQLVNPALKPAIFSL